MNKLLVTIYVPYLEESFDVFIPNNKKLNDILILSIKTICQLTNNNFLNNGELNFYNKDTGNVYDLNLLVSETDIKNGTDLILI